MDEQEPNQSQEQPQGTNPGGNSHYEEFRVAGEDLVEKIKELLHEGNIRRVIVKDENGTTLIEVPLTLGVVGVVDVASGKRSGEIKVGEEPEGVLVSRDGRTVYVTSEVASLVHVIDAASGKVTKNIKVGKRPRRFALTPDGSQLWVTNELGASVTVIGTKDHEVVDTIRFEVKGARAADITPVGLAMTADGKRAFVGLGKANHVAFVDVASRKVTDLVLAGKRAWGLGLNKAEDRLLVANGLSDDLTIIDVGAAKALKTVAVGRVPHSVVVVE